MIVRRWLMAGVGLAAGIAGVAGVCAMASCGEVASVPYGNPNTLARSNLPGEGGVSVLVCADAGVGTFDGGCPSFETDIYPYFAPTGPWHCGDKGCHGGTTDPPIDAGTPASCLAALHKADVAGLPYVNPDGGKDPAQSSILCNLQGSCGSKMPQPPGMDPSDTDLCKIEAWLKCGAPAN